MIARVARDMAIACAVLAVIFAVWKRTLTAPLGVIGGGVLIAISFWALRGTVDALVATRGEKRGGLALVKFFTRHVIVSLAAYGMMVRLHFDPLALLAGVSSAGMAAAVEALREVRWRRFL